MHNVVVPKIGNQSVAGLNRVKGQARFGSGEHLAQFHEAMTAAAGVEGVHRDTIAARRIEGPAIGHTQVGQALVSPLAHDGKNESGKGARFSTLQDLLHHHPQLDRAELGGHEKIFVGQNGPDIVDRFATLWESVLLLEQAVENAVDGDAVFLERFRDGRGD